MKAKKCLKEACGVFGICSLAKKDVSKNIYYALATLQHRGQESAGISTLDDSKIYLKKAMGLVADSFKEKTLSELKGSVGIGHVRYSTAGTSRIENAQPFMTNYPRRGISFCFNGNLVNLIELRKGLVQNGRLIQSENDAEIITNLLAEKLMKNNDLEKAIADCMNEIEGSYSAVFLTGEGELVAFRDPLGFRPFVWGESEDSKMFASESVALDINNVEKFSDVKPGEVIIVKNGEVERKQVCQLKERAHCMFEYVYFSRPDSIIEGKTVYDVRIKLGRNLARTYSSEADVVIPVPDTSRPAAEGVGRELGIPVCEGLIKNRYVWRTFIMPEQRARDDAVKLKMNPIKSVIKDKHVILVDDSIVRGTTSRKIIDLVKKSGAKKVELWITCPPIISPCFYGIDMATHHELIAANYSVEEIAKKINADKLYYQTIEGLIDAIGLKKEELCTACLTGRYPTPLAQSLADKLKTQTTVKRYYEVGD